MSWQAVKSVGRSRGIRGLSCSMAVLAVLSLAFSPFCPGAEASSSNLPLYAEGELLVKFKPHVNSGARHSIHKASGAMLKKRFSFIGADYIKLPGGVPVKEAIRQYRNNPDVEYAEPNYLVRRSAVLNDKYFGRQWGLRNTGQTITVDSEHFPGRAGSDIDAIDAWAVSAGNGSVIVAVIDSGVDYNHNDLKGRVLLQNGDVVNFVADNVDDNGVPIYKGQDGYCYNSANKEQDDPMDDDLKSHGTHVAGIIGAAGNNRRGVSGVIGVSPDIKILPVKVLDCIGIGEIKDVISGIEYAINAGAKIINASYSYPPICTSKEDFDLLVPMTALDGPPIAERSAIKAAEDAGILFVAAAGNSGCDSDDTPQYPASHALPYTDNNGIFYPGLQNLISVASSDQLDNMSSSSNYGKNSVHVAAPGVNILSTIRSGIVGKKSHISGYDYDTGTSMAAPFVSGLAALVWSKYPSYAYQDVKDAILDSAEPRPAFAGKTASGGRVNAFSALTGIPARPGALAVAFVSGVGVRLSWSDNSNLEEGFRIERKTGAASDYSPLATVEADAVSYSDSAISRGVTYHYRVAAYNSNGGSPASNEVSIKAPSSSINISVLGKGRVATDTLDINCKGKCSKAYVRGTSVTLTASPAAGHQFVKWTGACTGVSTTCTVTLDKNKNVAATFRALKK